MPLKFQGVYRKSPSFCSPVIFLKLTAYCQFPILCKSPPCLKKGLSPQAMGVPQISLQLPPFDKTLLQMGESPSSYQHTSLWSLPSLFSMPIPEGLYNRIQVSPSLSPLSPPLD